MGLIKQNINGNFIAPSPVLYIKAYTRIHHILGIPLIKSSFLSLNVYINHMSEYIKNIRSNSKFKKIVKSTQTSRKLKKLQKSQHPRLKFTTKYTENA